MKMAKKKLMIIKLIKVYFIHFTLLNLKSDDVVIFESRLLDTNEFSRLKLGTLDYGFIKYKSSLFSDFNKLFACSYLFTK
jgi:hypothetical protein